MILATGFFDKGSGVGLVRVDAGVEGRRRRVLGGFGWIWVGVVVGGWISG